ncbi:MAG: hypothetical protein KDD52_01655 [Bdellovibrionales bacterium]|nr:hypothetical protein [Bdellovibrionales bacterium]
MMDEVIKKISSYNIFNNLFPGILLGVGITKWSSFSITSGEVIVDLFLFYFFGLTASRVGSLIIEPLLDAVGFAKRVDYSEYIKAEKQDSKLPVLTEVNNVYRTLCAALIVLLGVKGFDILVIKIEFLNQRKSLLVVVLLIFLFLWSYRKQTKYIVERVKGVE